MLNTGERDVLITYSIFSLESSHVLFNKKVPEASREWHFGIGGVLQLSCNKTIVLAGCYHAPSTSEVKVHFGMQKYLTK